MTSVYKVLVGEGRSTDWATAPGLFELTSSSSLVQPRYLSSGVRRFSDNKFSASLVFEPRASSPSLSQSLFHPEAGESIAGLIWLCKKIAMRML